MSSLRHVIGITLVTLGAFILFGLLDGASTGRFVWEAAMFGAIGGALVYAGLALGFSRTLDPVSNADVERPKPQTS